MRGWADAYASWSSSEGAELAAEVGHRIRPDLGVFAYGKWTPRETSAGVGLRYTW